MYKFLLIILFVGATNLYAQDQRDSILVKEIQIIKSNVSQQSQVVDTLYNKLIKQSFTIQELENENSNLNTTIDSLTQVIQTNSQIIVANSENLRIEKRAIEALQSENSSLNVSIDSLNQLIQTNSQNIVANSKELVTKIQETGQKANTQIAQLDNNVEKNRLYWIIGTLATFLLGGLIYWLLGNRITSSKTDVETQIKNAKTSLEEESVKLDNKLVEVLETQLKLQQETAKSQPSPANEKEGHSLALKVADEIIRIQKNLSRMDESTKGLKQLNSSVKRIQDNFASNGYKLVEMLGKEYNEGMKATVNFVQDEDFDSDKRIITRIIKPQVNFKGKMIQTAQIEVTEA